MNKRIENNKKFNLFKFKTLEVYANEALIVNLSEVNNKTQIICLRNKNINRNIIIAEDSEPLNKE
jgi:hypothetical protein